MGTPAGPVAPGTPPAGALPPPLPGSTTLPDLPPPPARGAAEFACKGAPAGAPPPRRLARLTDVQYGNAMAVLWKGRRSAKNNYLPLPTGVVVPLESQGDAYRFTTYAGSHSLTEFEFRRSLILTEDAGKRLVVAQRGSGTCWGQNSGGAMFDACVDTLLRDKGALLFSRPLTAAELAQYGKIVRDAVPTLGRDDALALGFQALLLAPQFLFRVEIGEPVAGKPGTAKLDSFETAAALAYRLTQAPPDQELWDAAVRGEVATPEQLTAQLTRLLGLQAQIAPPPNGETPAPTAPLAVGAREFVIEHFEMPRVLHSPKANEEHCKYGRPRVLKDARLVVDDILGTNAKADFLKTLLTSQVEYYGCDSGKIFGVEMEPKTDSVKFTPPPGTRGGLLTHPAFLGGFAGFEETLPVKRGRYVNESLLCRPVPEIPIGVVPQLPPRTATTQMRDRLALHGKDPGCAACHSMLDPIGLAFENYDHTGKFRTVEATRPVDANGRLAGTDVDGPFKDAIELSARLAGSRQVQQCFLRHGFRYYLGREEDAFDSCTLDAAEKAYVAGGGNYHAFIAALVTSPSFTLRSF
jgi:hypothetical protein